VEIGQRSAADAHELAEIYRRIFGAEKAARKESAWTWQYEQVPGRLDQPVIFVARHEGRPVGQVGTMPVSLWWGTREVRASWGIDYFVAPEAEGLGYSIELVKAWMRSVDVALVMGLAPTSYLICKRLGFRDLGHVPFFSIVLDPAAVVRRRWGRLAGQVAAPASATIRALRGRRRGPTDVEVVAAAHIGPEYDALWDRVRQHFSASVRRDAAYVHWRYRLAPHRAYEVLEARRSGALVGFLVCCDEDYRGLRLGWIVDVFAAPDDARAHDALISAALQRFTDASIARVQVFAQNVQIGAALRRHGFVEGTSHSRLCVRPNDVPDTPLNQVGDWHIVRGDSDSDR
jgi:hypothetical protein